MRLLITNLLATALLLFGAASANAFAINLTSNYDGVSVLSPSDTVTVQVHLDHQGNSTGIIALSVGVEFDPGVLQYNQGASSTATYMLYINGKSPYLSPFATCSAGCDTWPLNPEQVNVDWGTTDITTPTAATGTSYANGTASPGVLATLVFHVVGAGDGIGEIFLNFDSNRGNTFTDGTLADVSGSVALGGTPINVITPEPSTALLVGLGLIGLGVAGRRRE